MSDFQDNNQMKILADSLWGYFKEKYLEPYLSDSVCYYVATVTTAPQNHSIGVQRPFDNEVFLPCASNAMGLQVGDPCTVLVFGDYSNQLVIGSTESVGSVDYGTPTNIDGVLVGDGSTIGAKSLDTSSLTNDNNHIPTSGVVKSALSYPSLGSFSTLAALGTLLDTALGTMANNSLYNIRVAASATVSPFVNTYVYAGTLIRSSSNYASCILEAMGQESAVLCRRSQSEGWTFQALATQDYANNLFALKEFAYFTQIAINGITPTTVQMEYGGAYLCIIMGNATQSQIMTVLVGLTGNVSHTEYGSNTAFTITDGSGNGRLTISYGLTNIRYAYFFSLNGAAVPTVVT